MISLDFLLYFMFNMPTSNDERQETREMRANTSLSTQIFKNGYCCSFNSLEMPHKNGYIHFVLFHFPFKCMIHNSWTLNVNHFHLFILISTQLKNGMGYLYDTHTWNKQITKSIFFFLFYYYYYQFKTTKRWSWSD